jgi:hypothetical protein
LKDDDRRTILRRRAFFVTSALAALGCARPATHADQSGNTLQVPSTPSEPAGSDSSQPPDRTPAPNARAGMPPTDVPDGVKPFTRSSYEHLYDVMAAFHGHIDSIEASIARCTNGFDKSCQTNELPQIAKTLNAIDDTLERIHSCGGSSPEAKAYVLREAEHLRFAQDRRTRMEESLKQLLATGGAAAENSLKTLRDAAAVPRPCLEYACPDW